MSVYFRGDNREPEGAKGIFLWGFERRAAGMSAGKLKKQGLVKSVDLNTGLRLDPGDMHPWAAVCMTTRLAVTPIFPVSNNDDRWIYAFELDDAFIKDPTRYSQYVDTHNWQKEKGFDWPLYAWEEAVGAVDPPDIIGAVKVSIQRVGQWQAKFQTTKIAFSKYSQVNSSTMSSVWIELKKFYHAHTSGFVGLTPAPTDNKFRK